MIEVNTSFQFSLVTFLKRPLSRVVDTGVVGVRGVSSLVLSKVEGWTGFFSNSFKSSWIYRSERRKKNIHVITLSSYSLLWRFWSSSESHPYRYEDWLYSSPSYTYKYWTIRWQFLSKKKSFSRKKKDTEIFVSFPLRRFKLNSFPCFSLILTSFERIWHTENSKRRRFSEISKYSGLWSMIREMI